MGIGRASDNRTVGAVFRYHPGRGAGFCHRNDGRGPDIVGCGTGGVGNGIGHVGIHQLARMRFEAINIVNIVLCAAGNARHGFYSLHRIEAGGSLAGKHNRTGTVVDGVGHIGRFGPGGAGILDHGIQHLRGRDHLLARRIDLVDNHLLDNRNLLQRNLHAHVAPGDHDTIGYTDNFVDVLHALQVFNLRNHIDAVALVLIQYLADLKNIIGASHKGSRDKVKAAFNTKDDIITVLRADIWHGKIGARHVHAFWISGA